MSTIEERLDDLLGAQFDAIVKISYHNSKVASSRRDALRASIAEDWNEMVRVLNKVIHQVYLPEYWDQEVAAILARVKGEGS